VEASWQVRYEHEFDTLEEALGAARELAAEHPDTYIGLNGPVFYGAIRPERDRVEA